ncbi:MAG: hypothetical protein FWC67_02370, partial [Defluviitaleaceae bacterium]|nr:hypothetical protein [Defluviitaleaceae bacterium]
MWKRKFRTIAAVTAVIMGTTAIILVMSLGIATNMNFESQIEALGHRALRINIGQNWRPEPGQ